MSRRTAKNKKKSRKRKMKYTIPPAKKRRKTNQPVYCICRGIDDGTEMVECYKCKEWFHYRCLKISPTDTLYADQWRCPVCDPSEQRESENDDEKTHKHKKERNQEIICESESTELVVHDSQDSQDSIDIEALLKMNADIGTISSEDDEEDQQTIKNQHEELQQLQKQMNHNNWSHNDRLIKMAKQKDEQHADEKAQLMRKYMDKQQQLEQQIQEMNATRCQYENDKKNEIESLNIQSLKALEALNEKYQNTLQRADDLEGVNTEYNQCKAEIEALQQQLITNNSHCKVQIESQTRKYDHRERIVCKTRSNRERIATKIGITNQEK
eukprot:227436_1